MIPVENRLSIWVLETHDDAQGVMDALTAIVTYNGGQLPIVSLTPDGWNLAGWAPVAVVERIRAKAPEFNYRVESVEEVAQLQEAA